MCRWWSICRLTNINYISVVHINSPFTHRRERVKPLLPMLNPSLWAGAVPREDTWGDATDLKPNKLPPTHRSPSTQTAHKAMEDFHYAGWMRFRCISYNLDASFRFLEIQQMQVSVLYDFIRSFFKLKLHRLFKPLSCNGARILSIWHYCIYGKVSRARGLKIVAVFEPKVVKRRCIAYRRLMHLFCMSHLLIFGSLFNVVVSWEFDY